MSNALWLHDCLFGWFFFLVSLSLSLSLSPSLSLSHSLSLSLSSLCSSLCLSPPPSLSSHSLSLSLPPSISIFLSYPPFVSQVLSLFSHSRFLPLLIVFSSFLSISQSVYVFPYFSIHLYLYMNLVPLRSRQSTPVMSSPANSSSMFHTASVLPVTCFKKA